MACIRKRRGKWVADYRDGAGIRHWKTCTTKREAEDFLSKAIPETRQWTRLAVDPNITLGEYADRWLNQIKPTIKPRTHTRYEELWRVHLKPTFEDMQVRQLHRGRIKGFLAVKLTELQPGRETLSRNTVRNIHATLRVILKSSVDDGVILSNPAEKLGRQLRLITPKSTRQEEIKAMTREQRQLFLETAAGVIPRYFPLFFTLAGTGMRLGEALALQPEDVDVRG
jgi:integrase